MEVLENAAKAHDPSSGQIIPYVIFYDAVLILTSCRIGPCDVTSKSDLDQLAKELSSKEKHLNLFVANAGMHSWSIAECPRQSDYW